MHQREIVSCNAAVKWCKTGAYGRGSIRKLVAVGQQDILGRHSSKRSAVLIERGVWHRAQRHEGECVGGQVGINN